MKIALIKRGSMVIAGIALLWVLGACSSSAKSTETGTPAPYNDPNIPPWINEIAPEDVIWGIGSAKQSSESFSMTSARNRAVVAIARQIDSKVQAMFTDYNRDAGTSAQQTNLSLQEDVSRTLTEAKLSGLIDNQKWRAPNGYWWYRVEYRKADAKNALAGIFESEAANYAEFKANQALEMMDAQLAKSNEKPLTIERD